MAKYIECEALLKSDNWQSLKSDFDKARAHIIILGQPAADVVEVVRCGQCKHFHEHPYKGTNDLSGWGKCKKIDMDIDLTINDFCSYGERKCEDG